MATSAAPDCVVGKTVPGTSSGSPSLACSALCETLLPYLLLAAVQQLGNGPVWGRSGNVMANVL